MQLRFSALAVAAVIVAAVAATSSCLPNTTVTNPPPADTVCQRGALKLGDSLGNVFSAANGCRTVDLYSAETTFANSYTLALNSGTGYLITMGTTDSNIYLRPALELVNTKKKLVAFDTYYWRAQAALVFVADSTVNWTVRAATLDTLAFDLGFYFIKAQQCRVPVSNLALASDTMTHADSLSKSDCKMPISDFNTNDSSRVQLYSMHIDSGQARTLTYRATAPLVLLTGPTYDTFAALPGSYGTDSTDSPSGTLEFAPAVAGDYTIVIGTWTYSTASVPYTLSISTEHAPSMQRVRLRQGIAGSAYRHGRR